MVRFGTVFLAAAIIQQLVDFLGAAYWTSKSNKPLVIGGIVLVLGVVAARVSDLYLLHNIGFLHGGPGVGVNASLAASSQLERWGDAFLTGTVIAAGSKP